MSKVPKWIADAFSAAWFDIHTMVSDDQPEALARELLARIPMDRIEAIIEAKVIGRLYEARALSTSKAVARAASDASIAIVAMLSEGDASGGDQELIDEELAFHRCAYDNAHKACDDSGAPRAITRSPTVATGASGEPEVVAGGLGLLELKDRIRWLGREWARERDALRALIVEARNTAEEALNAWLGWDLGSGRGRNIDEIRAAYKRLGLTPPPAVRRKP